MELKHLNAQEFETILQNGQPAMIDFSAVWCGPCQILAPVMEKLAEAYQALNPDVTIEVNQSDSTTGVTSAIEGACDLGMASRDLKDSETSEGAQATVIATDGIAVIVNPESAVEDLTSDQVKQIFTGEITSWSEIG